MTKVEVTTVDGVLIIDKPSGMTSHDVVQRVKDLIGAKKVGHLGTLDPAATGVLPLVINGATKHAARLAGVEKIYEFTLKLGVSTETDDDTGKLRQEFKVPADAADKLKEILPQFEGRIMQKPPAFSAVKIRGKRAYKLARRGEAVDPDKRPVHVDNISILDTYIPDIKMKLECKSGTYVRSICRDIGEMMGCGGHASGIRRLRSGSYTIDNAVSLDEIEKNPDILNQKLIPVED
ncbi:MAG: tRNA pseudouridine(55) synthase TruB [Deltaproteobacteria bacterium]|jgi:tRNA pseudouridine55 synthase|nr:tRNA pseudouridine(55) synthase TruB [Deltaproteobacteria bacterium]